MGTLKAQGKVSLDSRAWIIFFSLVIDLIGFTVILPLMPKLLDHYGQTEGTSLGVLQDSMKFLQEKLNIPESFNSVLTGGVLGSLFSFLQFIVSPVAGCLSDCYGRKLTLLISMIGIAGSYLLWAVADSFPLFVLARAAGGISKANVSLATAIMADITDAATRAKAMALVGIAFAIGFIVGPMTGAAFSLWGVNTEHSTWWFWPAIFAFVLATVNIIFVSLSFEESLPEDKRAKSLEFSQAWHLVNPFSLFNFKLAHGLVRKDVEKLKVLGRVYFLFLFLYSGLEFTLTFLTHTRFGFNATQQGRMLLFVGILMALFQGGLVRRVQAGKEKTIALLGLAVIIPSFVIVGWAPSITVLYLGLALYSLGSAIVIPCLTAMTAAYGRADQKGAVMGTLRSLGALARAIGPITSSIAFFVFGAMPSYFLGALGLILPLAMLRQSQV